MLVSLFLETQTKIEERLLQDRYTIQILILMHFGFYFPIRQECKLNFHFRLRNLIYHFLTCLFFEMYNSLISSAVVNNSNSIL